MISIQPLLLRQLPAVRAVLVFCRDKGYKKVEVESDSQSLISMLNRQTEWDVTLKGLLFDIDSLIVHFELVKFGFVSRGSNRAAHAVASFATTKHGGEFLWDEIGPNSLFNILAADVHIVSGL